MGVDVFLDLEHAARVDGGTVGHERRGGQAPVVAALGQLMKHGQQLEHAVEPFFGLGEAVEAAEHL